jgi:hypothetical protein
MGRRIISCAEGLGLLVSLLVGCVERVPVAGEDEGSTAVAVASTSTSGDPGTTAVEPSTTEPSTTTDGGATDESTGADDPHPPPPGGLGPWGFGYIELPEIKADWVDFADIDGDGGVDLFARWIESDANIVFTHYRGQGDGTFVEVQAWDVGWDSDMMRAGEFDGQLGLDVALFDGSGSDGFALFRNDGGGELGNPTAVGIEGFFEFGVAPMHDDLDDDHDLFVPLGWGEGGTVAVADGAGGFSLGANVAAPACYFSNVAVADLDGDGLDEVMGTGSCNSVPEVLPFMVYRHVAGVLTMDQSITSDLGPLLEGCDLALVDVDDDGDLDVVTGTMMGLFALVNEGGGVFADPPWLVPHAFSGYTQQVIPLVLEPALERGFLLVERWYDSVATEPPALVVPDVAWASASTDELELQGHVTAAADVDGDGRNDVAVIVGGETGTLGIWLSGG